MEIASPPTRDPSTEQARIAGRPVAGAQFGLCDRGVRSVERADPCQAPSPLQPGLGEPHKAPSEHGNQPALHGGVALDVSLGLVDRPVTGELLHVT